MYKPYDAEVDTSRDRIPHPMLTSAMITVKHLSLIGQSLDDSLLDKLFTRTSALESIDLSFNRFSPVGLVRFLKKIVENANIMQLRNICLAGNSL
mgnify:CR=1 FL=1